jgi:hypothetical protein
MATCIELFEIAFADARNLSNYEGEIENVRRDIFSATYGPPATRISRIEDYKNQVGSIKNKLQTLLTQAKQGTGSDCPAAIRDIEKFIAQADSVISKANAAQAETKARAEENAKKEAEAAAAAAAKKDNAGNGTPGSAGASGASGATGATGPQTPQGTGTSGATGATGPVTGASKPQTPQGVGATGASGASGAVGAGTPPTQAATPAAPGASGAAPSNVKGLTNQAREQQAVGEAVNIASKGDWRVRLSLANKANYFYNADSKTILAPLKVTNGIVFPYTPTISVNYSAKYDSNNPAHSNYNISQYQYSQVEDVTIGCEFTAQSTDEANYVLAVIHFLRSATKMFYGKDTDPIAGTPPPLVYLTGLGQYQFNGHPLVITGFTYSLPNDVDYIRTGIVNIPSGTGQTGGQAGSGGNPTPPQFNSEDKPTYIPTKISIQIRCLPIIARNVISNEFSLKKYASGELLLGKNNTTGGGIW